MYFAKVGPRSRTSSREKYLVGIWPRSTKTLAKRATPSTDPALSMVAASDHPMSLFQAGALRAFADLDLSDLKFLATIFSVELSGHTLMDYLEVLVSEAWPEWSQQRILDTLALRIRVPDEFEEMLQHEWVDEALHRADTKEMEEERQKQSRRTRLQKEITESYFTKRAASTKVGPSKPRQRKMPADMDAITKEAVVALLPPAWHAHSDNINARWQLWNSDRSKNISRSWLFHGYGPACTLALQAAWAHELMVQGKSLSECEVEGLFKESSTETEATASQIEGGSSSSKAPRSRAKRRSGQ